MAVLSSRRLDCWLSSRPALPSAAGLRAPWGTVVVANRWFARLDLSAAYNAQKRVVQQVCDLLDQVQRIRLDPARQAVEPDQGETWVKLRHNSEPRLEIRFVFSDGWVN